MRQIGNFCIFCDEPALRCFVRAAVGSFGHTENVPMTKLAFEREETRTKSTAGQSFGAKRAKRRRRHVEAAPRKQCTSSMQAEVQAVSDPQKKGKKTEKEERSNVQ